MKFNKEPGEVEQALIELSSPRVANGETFRWEEKGNQPLIRHGMEEDGDETTVADDLMLLEAEEIVTAKAEKVSEEPLGRMKPREAHYCRLRMTGLSQAKAYMAAGYSAKNVNSASVCATYLERRPRVQAYLRSLREATWTANVLSLAEKRNFLAEVVRTPVSTISEDSPLAQKLKVTTSEKGEYKEIEMPNKLKALELDAKLAGELKEQSSQSNAFQFNLIMDRMEMPTCEGYTVEQPPEALPE